jgi:hypothetical protein
MSHLYEELPRYRFKQIECFAIPFKSRAEWFIGGRMGGKGWFAFIPEAVAFKTLYPENAPAKTIMRRRRAAANGNA